MKVVFVVLHYCQAEVTDDCVRSLLALDGEKEVVIVDNASPDNSGLVLQEKYASNNNIHIILNETNYGFAQGNNTGFIFAKEQFKPDYIFVINNDTVIKDKHFITNLTSNPDYKQWHIIAPDILTFKGIHQNPFKMKGLSKQDVIHTIWRKRISYLFYTFPLIHRIKSSDVVDRKGPYIQYRLENIVPHGAAVIFTRQWIDKENFAFYPGTFMFYEEDLLFLYAQKKQYKILYEPTLQISHMEDMSTNFAHKNTRERLKFQSKCKIQSLKIILKEIFQE